MSHSIFSATLLRRIINLPDTGLDSPEFEILVSDGDAQTTCVISAQDLVTPQKLLSSLIRQTGRAPSDKRSAVAQIERATRATAPETIRTAVSGWRDLPDGSSRCFVTPARTFGARSREFEFSVAPGRPADSQIVGAKRGKLEAWKKEVGSLLELSSAGITLAGACLAAPLLPFHESKETFILLMSAESSKGKTSLLCGALSIQGRPVFPSPETTDQGLRELGAERNHLVLPVGDLNQIAPTPRKQFLHRLMYEVTSGDERYVSRLVRGKLPPVSYRTIVFCASEVPSTTLALADRSLEAGALARCFDLCADEDGYCDRMRRSDERTPAQLMERLQWASERNYGVVLPTWTRWLARHSHSELESAVRRERERFVAMTGAVGGLELRIARSFGFIAAALIMAKEADVISWRSRNILDAVMRSYTGAIAAGKVSAPQRGKDALLTALRAPGAIVNLNDEGVVGKNQEGWFGLRTEDDGGDKLYLRKSALRGAIGSAMLTDALKTLGAEGHIPQGPAHQLRVGAERLRLVPVTGLRLD